MDQPSNAIAMQQLHRDKTVVPHGWFLICITYPQPAHKCDVRTRCPAQLSTQFGRRKPLHNVQLLILEVG